MGRRRASPPPGWGQGLAGREKAVFLIKAHRLWESYLAKAELPQESLHEIADRLEHGTTPELVDKMNTELKHPKKDPHGKEIPE